MVEIVRLQLFMLTAVTEKFRKNCHIKFECNPTTGKIDNTPLTMFSFLCVSVQHRCNEDLSILLVHFTRQTQGKFTDRMNFELIEW